MTQEFSAGAKISWYRSPIDKPLLRKLMQRRDLRGWLQTISHLGLFFVTGLAAYMAFLTITPVNSFWSVPLLLLVLFIHGTLGPFVGLVAIHELQHRTVFSTKSLNEWFEKIYAFISWSDYIQYQQSHALHHLATCHSDYDGEIQLPQKVNFKQVSFWLAILAWHPLVTVAKLALTWSHAKGNIQGAWNNHVLPACNSELRRKHRNWARLLLVGHGLLAMIFILTGHWFLIVVFTFGTHYCSWLGFLCGLPQHIGLNSNIADFRYSTRTYTCSWLPAFYYWNMQYHLEHHMYPAVPFYNLPRLHQAIKHDLPTATHGLWATWRDILAIRANQRADSDYVHVPKIPGQSSANTEPVN